MESRGRSVLGEVRVDDNAAAFVPRREIPRTPPRLLHHQPLKTASPTVSTSVKPEERDSGCRLHGKSSSANPSKLEEGGRENDPPANWGSPFNQQAPCFTPRKTLARSPPRPITPTTPNNAPPPTRFEILRTPLAIKPVSPPQRRVEVHQPPRVESRTSQIQPAPAQKEPAPPKLVSPPIITADKREKRGVGLLPDGLVCTENDLAFLQCMETVQRQRQLQRELSGLDKAVKTAAQEKEQLSHQAQKIQTDVRQMKEKYVATLSSVHSLQLTSDDPNSAHLTGVTPEEPTTAELSHAHLARLRQTRKLMAVQLEKTEREIQRKIYVISQEREAVEDKRVKESLNVDELRKDLENIQLEKREWEERVRKASDTKQAMEKELESLQSQLKASQTVPTDLSPPHTQSASSERREANERLRRLVKRCELYVRRHELLKQLRQQI